MLDRLWFKNICRENHYDVNDLQIELLDKYVGYLLEWNKKINLISRMDTENIWLRHILSSIALLFNYKFIPGLNMMDVGTGGGLPGIPIAIMNPNSNFMLLDSIQKKIKAVDHIIKSLGLRNVHTYCGRAEELAKKKEFIHHYDYVIARAVSSIAEIVRWCKPFLRMTTGVRVVAESERTFIKTGSIVLLKGGDLESEIMEAKVKFNLKNLEVFPIVIHGIDTTRIFDKKIVIIQP